MAGVLNQKYNFKLGFLFFGCTLFLFLMYQHNKNLPIRKSLKPHPQESSNRNHYKLVNERDVFGDIVDSNSSVQLKTFYNTTLHPPGVILQTKGGIGNQLYQYACSYALAKDLGWPLYLQFDRKTYYQRFFHPGLREFALDQFQIHFENIIDKTTNFSAKINDQNDRTFLQRPFLDIRDPQNQFVRLNTYCQSIEFWKNYQDEIRAFFKPRKSAINFPKIQKIINKIRNTEESVAVHVRRGDFVSAKPYFVPISYQRYALRKMISILKARGKKKPVFFVFSDDIAQAENKLKDFAETNELVFVRKGVPDTTSVEDFYLMTLCKHFIIPNSTFSWWAAFVRKYVDKIVIASAHNPNYYWALGDQDYFFDTIYGKLYHPKDWIVIDPFTGGLVKND